LIIGVDGRAFASPAGGVRLYVVELYSAMREVDPSIEIVAIGAEPAVPLPPGVGRRGAMSFPTNLGWMAASLPLAARGAGLDVFYARHPEWHPYKNDPWRRAFYRQSARSADRILTDSEFSRSEIVAAYGIAAERISVVPLAASLRFTPGPFDPVALPPTVSQPYALHVGDLHARRNLKTALAAVLSVRRLGVKLSFVCAGVDRGVADALREDATSATDPDALAMTGPLDDDALVNLCRGASMLLYPSRYEGFGLPVLEAMQCGTPVISARAASMPEIMGHNSVIVDPIDTDAWAKAIIELMEDDAWRRSLADAGLRRAAQISWTRTATETLGVMEHVLHPSTSSTTTRTT
jgi:glycosyltransferase involved in cell wall biosynthesis